MGCFFAKHHGPVTLRRQDPNTEVDVPERKWNLVAKKEQFEVSGFTCMARWKNSNNNNNNNKENENFYLFFS